MPARFHENESYGYEFPLLYMYIHREGREGSHMSPSRSHEGEEGGHERIERDPIKSTYPIKSTSMPSPVARGIE